jgi:hydrogenase maturation protease
MPSTIRVLGLGNVLTGDDGFGPAVISVLQAAFEWPAHVEVLDVGTPGLDLTPFVGGAQVVVLVDTVASQGAPGELRVYDKAALLRHAPQPRVGPHDPGVKEALLILEFAQQGPEAVTLVGVIPAASPTTPGLSAPLRAAVAPAVEAVLAALAPHGVVPARRPLAAPVQPWWETAPLYGA